MNMIDGISPEWQRWIVENLNRGCTVESMVQMMVAQNFDRFYAEAIIRQCAAGAGGARLMPAQPEMVAKVEKVARVARADYVYEKQRLAAGNVIMTDDWPVRIASCVSRPVVAVFDNVLSHEECDELIRRSLPRLKRSTIVDPNTGASEVIDARSSEGTYFMSHEDPFIASLDKRLAQVMNGPVENGEGLQILHYGIGAEYRPHFDYFPLSDAGSGRHLSQGGQRVSTLVMYLNDVEEGGGTIFPELGMTVIPRKGGAVYFEYANSLGQVDSMTLHGGAPVVRGEKWIATKWMREHRFGG